MSDIEQSIGDTLRKSREKKGLSVEDLASQIKVNSKYLEDIENNIFLDEQLLAYTKGHIKLYCQAVSVNSDKILKSFDENFQTYYNNKYGKIVKKHENKNTCSSGIGKKLAILKCFIFDSILKFKVSADDHNENLVNVDNVTESENVK